MICKITMTTKLPECEETITVETDTSSADCLQTFSEVCYLNHGRFDWLLPKRLNEILREKAPL